MEPRRRRPDQFRLRDEPFEARVNERPDAIALVYEDDSLTYGALNARANQLARHLRARGVGPDVLVGVALERSIEMIVALLAISRPAEPMCRSTQHIPKNDCGRW